MKENTTNKTAFFKGDIHMKKSFAILALALVLIFAMTAIAGAKYAGYENDAITFSGAKIVGYLSWKGAKAQMTAAGVPTSAQQSPHGGYATTTTKCVVCHSTHRAAGGAAVGTVDNKFLTAGDAACVQCHTTWGATPANLLVEWAETGTGPHGGDHGYGPACSNCHRGGIHGGGSSKYHAFNNFLFGASSDELADAELPLQDRTANGGNALVSATGTDSSGNAAYLNWFVNGTTSASTIGGLPSTFAAAQRGFYAAQKSLVTGWVCGQEECHVNSVFGNIVWGQTYSRAATGTVAVQSLMTGHSSVPTGFNANHTGACGPCHVGSYAGGYALGDTPAGTGSDGYTPESTNPTGSGCDQCHDLIGKATNSTAFPHADRAITVYEWTGGTAGGAVGTRTAITAPAGNIWMYAFNQASLTTTNAAGSRTKLVDPNVKLVTGAVGTATPGNIRDGVCLKCHVNIDPLSTQLAFDAVKPSLADSSTAVVADYTLKISGGHHSPAWTTAQVEAVSAAWANINPYSGNVGISGNSTIGSGASTHYGNNLLYTWR
ncbi:MAG: cytochrome c3 family protein [Actinomycetes bacterium]|nr:cytochrome c3 family protein [Actinomycetes bacterium]